MSYLTDLGRRMDEAVHLQKMEAARREAAHGPGGGQHVHAWRREQAYGHTSYYACDGCDALSGPIGDGGGDLGGAPGS